MRVWRGWASVKFDAIGEAVDSKISLIASATFFIFPLPCKTKAAEPAVNGADEKVRDRSRVHGRVKQSTQPAILVPEARPNVLSGRVLRIFPPGAETAGLKSSSLDGPKLENEDMMPPVSVFGSPVGRFLKETVTFFPWAKLSTSYKSHKGRQPGDCSCRTYKGSYVFLDQNSGEVFSVDNSKRLGIARDARFHQLRTRKAHNMNTHL